MSSWISKFSSSDIISLLALLVSGGAFFQTIRISAKEEINTKNINRNKAERLLDEALDLMNSGRQGTEFLHTCHERPPSPDERPYLELARRKIDDANFLAPDFYLCHQYEGIYVHRTQGRSVEERASNSLKYHQKAVKLWKEDKDPRVKNDGWPYHDLALVYEHLGRYKEAEEYFLKALEVNRTTELYFHRDFSIFLSGIGRENESIEYMNEAKKIAQATGKELPHD
ncbi:MAG: tetratricopeptide repeat protein [Tildeniella torsiva UHER 1998/13D]|nr:tetratricopeptide repeat protein [Tildeniella torsiva UHER 1998/13D]